MCYEQITRKSDGTAPALTMTCGFGVGAVFDVIALSKKNLAIHLLVFITIYYYF